MVIQQGGVYWVNIRHPDDVYPRIPHPHVIIQENILNQNSSVGTVMVCAVTTNVKKITIPGNVLLETGEANLSRQSIVEVSKVITIDKTALGEYIGILSEYRMEQILAGIRFVQRSHFDRHSND